METIIAVILAVLIVAGVFVAAICIALMKKSKDGQKTSRQNTNGATRTNQFTNNLTAGNSNIRASAANMENNRQSIGVFHIHVNANSQTPSRHNINNTEKTAHEEPPPSYFDLFPQQETSTTDEYQQV